VVEDGVVVIVVVGVVGVVVVVVGVVVVDGYGVVSCAKLVLTQRSATAAVARATGVRSVVMVDGPF